MQRVPAGPCVQALREIGKSAHIIKQKARVNRRQAGGEYNFVSFCAGFECPRAAPFIE